ncbi:MAG TPA: tail fiber domain-containing protein [Cytophagales bacterium]
MKRTLPIGSILLLLLTALPGLAQTNLKITAPTPSVSGTEKVTLGSALGYTNTFLGTVAGYSNTAGTANTFIGDHAGFGNDRGNNNVCIGAAAGFTTLNSSDNVFVGVASGSTNTTGNGNTFLGTQAGLANQGGFFNTFVGKDAGRGNVSGSLNTFTGQKAGAGNTTGFNNTFTGHQAGAGNTTGFSNTFSGAQAGSANTTGSRNTFLGLAAGSNSATGGDNVFVGFQAGSRNTSGSGNSALGELAGPGSGNLSNATAIGSRAQVSVSNAVVIGSVNGKNGATANARVGIGTTAPTHQLQLSTDDAAKPGTSSWKVASDKRLKKDLKDFTDGLEVLRKVNPVWFRYTGEAGMPTDKKYVGVVAQQMQKVAPYTIDTFTHLDSTGKATQYLNYDATALTYILVNAVKELERQHRQEIDAKDARLEAQQKQLEALEARLRKLEGAGIAAGRTATPGTDVAPGAFPTARLWQNQPNPYGQSTLIRYLVPATATTAELRVFSLTGEQVYRRALTTGGAGQVEISGRQLPAGTYQYCLVVDGQVTDTRKMILTP